MNNSPHVRMRTDHSKKLVMSDYLSLFSVGILCLCICRAGHDDYVLPVPYVSVAILAMNLFRIKELNLSQFKSALPFSFAIYCLILVQVLVNGASYSISSAFWGAITFTLFLLDAIVLLYPEYLTKYYWKIINFVILSASGIILVEYAAFMAGIKLYNLPVLGDWVFYAWEFNQGGTFRPCAFFSEASHYAELALFSAFYYLYVARSLPKFMLISLACLASTSSLGILGCLGLALAYVFFFAYSRRRLSEDGAPRWAFVARLALIVVSVSLVIGAALYVSTSDSWLATRLMDGGTSSMRVGRSFELFNMMKPGERLFGIGVQNQALYLEANRIVLPSDLNETLVNREFAATVGYVLCTCGVIGLASFIWMFISNLTRTTPEGRVVITLALYVVFTCCVFSRAIFVVILLMVFAYGTNAWTVNNGNR